MRAGRESLFTTCDILGVSWNIDGFQAKKRASRSFYSTNTLKPYRCLMNSRNPQVRYYLITGLEYQTGILLVLYIYRGVVTDNIYRGGVTDNIFRGGVTDNILGVGLLITF